MVDKMYSQYVLSHKIKARSRYKIKSYAYKKVISTRSWFPKYNRSHYFAKLLPGKLSKIISTFTQKEGRGDHLQKLAWLDMCDKLS